MSKETKGVLIKKLSELTGVRQSTLRYYASERILPFKQKERRLARRFDLKAIEKRLAQIREAKKNGKRMVEIIKMFKRK